MLWLMLTQDGMHMKDAFRKEVCLECWVAILSFWSSATLASLANDEDLGWLEPKRLLAAPTRTVRRRVCILAFVSRML